MAVLMAVLMAMEHAPSPLIELAGMAELAGSAT